MSMCERGKGEGKGDGSRELKGQGRKRCERSKELGEGKKGGKGEEWREKERGEK